jgi:group I intron endonuclease
MHSNRSDLPDKGRSGTYRIANLKTGDTYVGGSIDLPARFRRHRHELKRGTHPCRKLQAAWALFGHEAFTFEILVRCLPSEVRAKEQALLDSGAGSYNYSRRTDGGNGPHTPETRQKMSMSAKARSSTPEGQAHLKAAGSHPRSAETRARISAALKGAPKKRKDLCVRP